MKRTNTTLDREPMNSEAIRQRQDFNYILKGATAAKVPIWKSIWFYGPVGIAMVTMVVSAVRMNPENEINENKTTLSQIDILNTETETAANTLVVEKSNEELTETKSDSNKENTTLEEKVVTPLKAAHSTTPIVKNDPVQINPTSLEREKNSIEPEELGAGIIPSEPEPIEVKKISKTMPSIAGVFNGRVSVSQICADGIIECNNGYRVISYDIQYDNGTGSTVDRVSSNKIPNYICGNLKRYNVGGPVFITKIIAVNERGERKQLLSMNIEPTF